MITYLLLKKQGTDDYLLTRKIIQRIVCHCGTTTSHGSATQRIIPFLRKAMQSSESPAVGNGWFCSSVQTYRSTGKIPLVTLQSGRLSAYSVPDFLAVWYD